MVAPTTGTSCRPKVPATRLLRCSVSPAWPPTRSTGNCSAPTPISSRRTGSGTRAAAYSATNERSCVRCCPPDLGRHGGRDASGGDVVHVTGHTDLGQRRRCEQAGNVGLDGGVRVGYGGVLQRRLGDTGGVGGPTPEV